MFLNGQKLRYRKKTMPLGPKFQFLSKFAVRDIYRVSLKFRVTVSQFFSKQWCSVSLSYQDSYQRAHMILTDVNISLSGVKEQLKDPRSPAILFAYYK